jgi:putative aldouronate transport system substrate-binding protein
LAGYPNDGSVLVDKATMTIRDSNTSEDTIKYFKKLNEE